MSQLVARSLKRPLDLAEITQEPIKRTKNEGALVGAFNGQKELLRTSHLLAPNMLLQGHEAEVFTARFAGSGDIVATAGFDKQILLWNVWGECENYSHFKGHKHSVMDLKFSTDTSCLFSGSADKTVRAWDLENGKCFRNFSSHTDIVNSVSPNRRGAQIICSASDDGLMLVHDFRQKKPCQQFINNAKIQLTSVAFSDTAEYIFCAGVDNVVKCFDRRKEQVVYNLEGHGDTITDLMLSPDGQYLLSNSMDMSAIIWDVKPYCTGNRKVSAFVGHQHNFEKNLLKCAWSPDGKRISCGSSDRLHNIWDVKTQRPVYRLPGHQGSVNAVDFHPKEGVILSGSSDKLVYISEIDMD